MTFIITLISLLIERFFDWTHVRQWRWFVRYQSVVNAKAGALPVSALLLLSVLPLSLAVAAINYLLMGWLYGILKLIFGVFVLVYCLGPANFWAQTYKSFSILREKAPQPAIEKLFGLPVTGDSQSFHRFLTNTLFLEANRRVFAVFFWFILLGPFGAVLYRLVDLSKAEGRMAQAAQQMQSLLDWLPVRVLAFIFALGGHFTQVIQHWKQGFLRAPKNNDIFLTECGIAALDVLEAKRIPEDGSAEKETVALLDRVLVMALVILAVIVLIT